MTPFHVKEIFGDLDDRYWCNKALIDDTTNTHVPLNNH